MAQDNIRVRVKAVGLDKDIANQARIGEKKIKPINLSLNEKGLAQPLGRITGQMGEFEKSMDAAVARVFAFGAAVGVINGVSDALKGMAQSAIEVEKALKDINVIMNMTQSQLQGFSSELFNVAKNTTTSFKDITAAATEFARQGLSAEETLRRIEDAMILTRLSGMDAVDSVSALTAAINGFSSAALSSTDIVNRLANVDAAFAVSSKDLADGLARAGATAQSAKVNFNELLAAVTSVQQQTARGGAVIGNSFKSIFTRLQRSSVREALEGIGVATQNAAGEFRSSMAVLQDYAAMYDKLSDAQRASTDELIAGVFQVNNLKALIKDLNNEYSIYGQALSTANNTTNEAIKRNEELNKTMSALLTQTGLSIKEMAASIGEITLGPGMEKVLGVIKGFTDGINNLLGEDKGFNIGKTLLKGIGAFVSGPGMILIGGAFIKLFAFIAKQGMGALKSIFAINSETKRQEGLQAAILQILMNEEGVRKKILGGAMSQSQKEKEILGVLKRQTAERIAQDALLKKIAASSALANVAVTPMGTFQPYGQGARRARGKADLGLAQGYIPSFNEEQKNINKGVGGASKDAKPVLVKNFQSSKTKKQDVVANTDEVMVKNFMGSGASAILNRDMVSRFGMPVGAEKIGSLASYGGASAASLGYIPSFAKNKNLTLRAGGAGMLLPQRGESLTSQKYTIPASKAFKGKKMPESLKGKALDITGLSIGKIQGKGGSFDEIVDAETQAAFGRIGSKILGGKKSIKPAGPLSDYLDKSAGPQVSGRLFEASLNYIQGAIQKNEGGTGRWDFPALGSRLGKDVFGLPSTSIGKKFDAKNSESVGNIGSLASKIIADRGGASYLESRLSDKKSKSIPRKGKLSHAEGFIPNFKIRDVNNGIRNGLNTRRIEDPESMSSMTYSKRGLNTRNIEWMQSFQKGDAFKLFASAGRSKFMKQGGSYISETIKQQRAFKQGSKTNFEDLVYAYPQLKYRMQDGMVTSGRFIDERNMNQYKFKDLDDLRSHVNSMNRKDFQSILGSNTVSDRFLMTDLDTKLTAAKSDGGVLSLIGKMASGMIPNFALSRNKGMRRFYDFDETLGTYGSNVKSADLFKAQSASWAKPTPLAKQLQGKTISILTARAKQSVPFIEERLRKWGINPDRILTTADMFNDLKIANDKSGKIIKGKGRIKGFRNLKPAEKKALLLQRMHKKHGGKYNLIDDALENIEAIHNLKNSDITATHYSFAGQAMGRGSGNAGGYVPNFVNIKAMQELAKRGSTKGERSAAQNLLNKQSKKIKTIKSKNLYDKMFLESYIQGSGMQSDLDLLSRKGYDANLIKSLRASYRKNPQNVKILSGGIVPNYNFVDERLSEASNASAMYNSPVRFDDTLIRDLEVKGKTEKVVVNNKEKFYKTGKDVQQAFNLPFAPDGGMVLPPPSSRVGKKRIREFGEKMPAIANGMIPNFAPAAGKAGRGKNKPYQDDKSNVIDLTPFTTFDYSLLFPTRNGGAGTDSTVRGSGPYAKKYQTQFKVGWNRKGISPGLPGTVDDIAKVADAVERDVKTVVYSHAQNFVKSFGENEIRISSDSVIQKQVQKHFNKGSITAMAGNAFEAAANAAFGNIPANSGGGDFDVRGPSEQLRKFFNWPPAHGFVGDFKANAESGDIKISMADKILKELDYRGLLSGQVAKEDADFDKYNKDVAKQNKQNTLDRFRKVAAATSIRGARTKKAEKGQEANVNTERHLSIPISTPTRSGAEQEDYFRGQMGLYKGFIPNYEINKKSMYKDSSDALGQAISREHQAGIPISKIRVAQSNRLINESNPAGLGVINTYDEPAGIDQGINRAISQGKDPQFHGLAGQGYVPNFFLGPVGRLLGRGGKAAKGVDVPTPTGGGGKFASTMMFAPMLLGGFEGTTGEASGYMAEGLTDATQIGAIVSMITDKKGWIALGAAVGAVNGTLDHYSKSLQIHGKILEENINFNQKIIEGASGVIQAQTRLNEAMKSGNTENVQKSIEQLQKTIEDFPSGSNAATLRDELLAANGDIAKMTEALEKFSSVARKTGSLEKIAIDLGKIEEDRKGLLLGFGPSRVPFSDVKGEIGQEGRVQAKQAGSETIKNLNLSEEAVSKLVDTISNEIDFLKQSPSQIKNILRSFGKNLDAESRRAFETVINNIPDDVVVEFTQGIQEAAKLRKQSLAAAEAVGEATAALGSLKNSIVVLSRATSRSVAELNKNIDRAFALAEKQFDSELSILKGLNIITGEQVDNEKMNFNIAKINSQVAAATEFSTAEFVRELAKGMDIDTVEGKDGSVFSGAMGDILTKMYGASIPMSGQDPRFLTEQIISKIADMAPEERSKEEQELLDRVVELNQKASSQIELLKKQNQIADRQATMASRVALRNSQLNMDREGEVFSNFAFASKFEPRTALDRDIQARSKMDMLNILEPLFGVDEGSRKMRQEAGTQQAIGNVQRILLGMGIESDQGFMSEKEVSIPSLIDAMKTALISGDHSKGQNDMLAYMIRGLEKQQAELAKTAKDPSALQRQTIEATAKDLGIDIKDLGFDLDGLGFESLNAIADELGKEPVELKHLISMDQNIAEMKISLAKFEALPAILSKLEEIKGQDKEKVETREEQKTKEGESKEKIQSIVTKGLSVAASGSTQVNAGSVDINTNGSRSGANAASGFIPNFASEDSLRNKLSGASWSKGNKFTSGVVSGIMSTNSGDSYLQNRGFSEYEGKTFTGGAALRVAGFYPGATSAIFREMSALEKQGVADPLSQVQLTIPKSRSNFTGLGYEGAVVTNKMDEGGVSASNYISKIRAIHGVTPRDESFSTTGLDSLGKKPARAFGSMSALAGMAVVPNFVKGKSSVKTFRKIVDELSEALDEIAINPLKEGVGGQTNKRVDNINSLKRQIVDILNADSKQSGRVKDFLSKGDAASLEMNKILSEKLGIHGLEYYDTDIMEDLSPLKVDTHKASTSQRRVAFGYDALHPVKMGEDGLTVTSKIRTNLVNQGERGLATLDLTSPSELISDEEIALDKDAREKAELEAKRAAEKKSLGRRLKDKLPKFTIADRLNLRGLENFIPKWATKEGGKQILSQMGERARNYGTGIRERLNLSRILEGRSSGNIEEAVEAFDSDTFIDDVKDDSPVAKSLFSRLSEKAQSFKETQIRKARARAYLRDKRKRERTAELEEIDRQKEALRQSKKSEKERLAAEEKLEKERLKILKEAEAAETARIQQKAVDDGLGRTRTTVDGVERVIYNDPVYKDMSLMDQIKARAANFAGFTDTQAQVQMEMNRQYNARKLGELAQGRSSGRTAFDDFKMKAWGIKHAAESSGSNLPSGVEEVAFEDPARVGIGSTPDAITNLGNERAAVAEETFSDKMQKFLKRKFGKVFTKPVVNSIGDFDILDGSGRAVGKMQDGQFIEYNTKDDVVLYDGKGRAVTAQEVIDVNSRTVDPLALDTSVQPAKSGALVQTQIKSQAELRELFRAHQAGEISKAEASQRLAKVLKEDPSLAQRLNLKSSEGVLALEDTDAKSMSSRIGRGGDALQTMEQLIKSPEFEDSALKGMSGGQPVEELISKINAKKSYRLPDEKLAIDSIKSPEQIASEAKGLESDLALQQMRKESPEFLKRNLGLKDLSDKDLLEERIAQQRQMFEDQMTNPKLSKEQGQRVGALKNNFEANVRFFQDLNKKAFERQELFNLERVKRHARDATETLLTAGGRAGLGESSTDIVNTLMRDPERFRNIIAAGTLEPGVSQLGDITALFKHMNPEQIVTWKKIAQANIERLMLGANLREKLPNQLTNHHINQLTNVEKNVGMGIVEPFIDELALKKQPFTVGGLIKHLDIKRADGSPLARNLGIDAIIDGIKQGKLFSAMARKNKLIPSEKPDAELQVRNLLNSPGLDPKSLANRMAEISAQQKAFDAAQSNALSEGSSVVRPEDVRKVISEDGKLDFSNITASDQEIENAREAMDQIRKTGDQKVSGNDLAKSLDPADPISQQKQLILESFLKKSGILKSNYRLRFSEMLEKAMANGGQMSIAEGDEMAQLLDVQRHSPRALFRDDDTELAQRLVNDHFKQRGLGKVDSISNRILNETAPTPSAAPVEEAGQVRSNLRELEGVIADTSAAPEAGAGQDAVDEVIDQIREVDPEVDRAISESPDTPATKASKSLADRTRAIMDWVVDSGLWKGTSQQFKSGFGTLAMKDGVMDLTRSMIDKLRKRNERALLEKQFEDTNAPKRAAEDLLAQAIRDESLDDSFRRNPKTDFEKELEQSLAGKKKVGDKYKFTRKTGPKIGVKDFARIEGDIIFRRAKATIAATKDPLDASAKPKPLMFTKGKGSIKDTGTFKDMQDNLNWGDRRVQRGDATVSFADATQEERVNAIAEEIKTRINQPVYELPAEVSSEDKLASARRLNEQFAATQQQEAAERAAAGLPADPNFQGKNINEIYGGPESRQAATIGTKPITSEDFVTSQTIRGDELEDYLENFKTSQTGTPEEIEKLVDQRRELILSSEKTEQKITTSEAKKRAQNIIDNASTARTIRTQQVLDDAVNLGGGLKGMTATVGLNVGAMALANSESGMSATDYVANALGAGDNKFMIGDKDGRFLSRSGKPFKPGATQKIDTGAGTEEVAISPAIFPDKAAADNFLLKNSQGGFNVVNARDSAEGRELLRSLNQGFSQDKGILGVDNTELVGTGLGVGLESLVAGGLALKGGATLGTSVLAAGKAGGIALAPALGIYGGEYLRDEFSGATGEALGLASYTAGGAIAGALIGGPKGAIVGGIIGAAAYGGRVAIGEHLNFDHDEINSTKFRMTEDQLKARRQQIIDGAKKEAEEIRHLMDQIVIANQQAQEKERIDLISGKPLGQGMFEKSVLVENQARAEEKGRIIASYLRLAQKMDERILDHRDLYQEGYKDGGFKHDYTHDEVNRIFSETMGLFGKDHFDPAEIKRLAEEGRTREEIAAEMKKPEYTISRINPETGKVEEYKPNTEEKLAERKTRSEEYLKGLTRITDINRRRGTLRSGSDFVSSVGMSERDVRRLGNLDKDQLKKESDADLVNADQTLMPDRRELLFRHKNGTPLKKKSDWMDAISRGSLQYGKIMYPMEMAKVLGIATMDSGKIRKREDIEKDIASIHGNWSTTGSFKFPRIFSDEEMVTNQMFQQDDAERFFGIQRDGWDIQKDPNTKGVIMSHPDHGIVEFPFLRGDGGEGLDSLLRRYQDDILKSGYEENVAGDPSLQFGFNDRQEYGDSPLDSRKSKTKYRNYDELAKNLPPERRKMLAALSALMRRGEGVQIASKVGEDGEFERVRINGTTMRPNDKAIAELKFGKSKSYKEIKERRMKALALWPSVMGTPEMLQHTSAVELARAQVDLGKDFSSEFDRTRSVLSAQAMLGAVPAKEIEDQHEKLKGLLGASGKTMQWWNTVSIGSRAKEYNDLVYNKNRMSGLSSFVKQGGYFNSRWTGYRNELTGEILTADEKVSGEQRTLDNLRKTISSKFDMFDVSPKDQMLSPEEIDLMSAQFENKNYKINGGGQLTSAERAVAGAEAGTKVGPLFKKIFDMNAGEDGMLSRQEVLGDKSLPKNVSEVLRGGYMSKIKMDAGHLELAMLKYFSGQGFPEELSALAKVNLSPSDEEVIENYKKFYNLTPSDVKDFRAAVGEARAITDAIPYHQTVVKTGSALERKTAESYKGLFEARENLRPTADEENAIVSLSERMAQIKFNAGGEESKGYLDLQARRQQILNKKKKFQEVDKIIKSSVDKGLFHDGGPFSTPYFLEKNVGNTKYSGLTNPNWRPDKIDSNWKQYYENYFKGSRPAAQKLDAMETALIDAQLGTQQEDPAPENAAEITIMEKEAAERKKFIEDNMNATAKKVFEKDVEGNVGDLDLFGDDVSPDKPQLTNIFDPLSFIQKYSQNYNSKKGELWRAVDSSRQKFEDIRAGAVKDPHGATAAEQRSIALKKYKDAMARELKHRKITDPSATMQDVLNRKNYADLSNTDWALGSTYKDFFDSYDESTVKVNTPDGSNVAVDSQEQAGRLIYKDRKDEIDKVLKARGLMTGDGQFVSKVGETPITPEKIYQLIATTTPGSNYVSKNSAKFEQLQKIWASKYGGKFTRGAMGLFDNEGAKLTLTSSSPIGDLNNTAFAGQTGGDFAIQRRGVDGEQPEVVGQFDTLTPQDKLMHAIAEAASKGFKERASSTDFRSIYKSMSLNERELFKTKYADKIESTVPVGIIQQLNSFIDSVDQEELYGAARGDRIPNYIKLKVKHRKRLTPEDKARLAEAKREEAEARRIVTQKRRASGISAGAAHLIDHSKYNDCLARFVASSPGAGQHRGLEGIDKRLKELDHIDLQYGPRKFNGTMIKNEEDREKIRAQLERSRSIVFSNFRGAVQRDKVSKERIIFDQVDPRGFRENPELCNIKTNMIKRPGMEAELLTGARRLEGTGPFDISRKTEILETAQEGLKNSTLNEIQKAAIETSLAIKEKQQEIEKAKQKELSDPAVLAEFDLDGDGVLNEDELRLKRLKEIAAKNSAASASGFKPSQKSSGSFKSIASEMLAAKKAGYKTPLRPDEVGLAKLRTSTGRFETRTVNKREKLMNVAGMDFVVPPREEGGVARKYASEVKSEFGFDPYDESTTAASGFSPTSKAVTSAFDSRGIIRAVSTLARSLPASMAKFAATEAVDRDLAERDDPKLTEKFDSPANENSSNRPLKKLLQSFVESKSSRQEDGSGDDMFKTFVDSMQVWKQITSKMLQKLSLPARMIVPKMNEILDLSPEERETEAAEKESLRRNVERDKINKINPMSPAIPILKQLLDCCRKGSLEQRRFEQESKRDLDTSSHPFDGLIEPEQMLQRFESPSDSVDRVALDALQNSDANNNLMKMVDIQRAVESMDSSDNPELESAKKEFLSKPITNFERLSEKGSLAPISTSDVPSFIDPSQIIRDKVPNEGLTQDRDEFFREDTLNPTTSSPGVDTTFLEAIPSALQPLMEGFSAFISKVGDLGDVLQTPQPEELQAQTGVAPDEPLVPETLKDARAESVDVSTQEISSQTLVVPEGLSEQLQLAAPEEMPSAQVNVDEFNNAITRLEQTLASATEIRLAPPSREDLTLSMPDESSLVLQAPEELPQISIDASKLSEAVENLNQAVQNASSVTHKFEMGLDTSGTINVIADAAQVRSDLEGSLSSFRRDIESNIETTMGYRIVEAMNSVINLLTGGAR